MKTPKSSSSSKNTKGKAPKFLQPKPLQVIHPSPSRDAPQPSSQEHKSSTPKTMHAGSKRTLSNPKGSSSSRPAKRIKQADPNSAEELAKEMPVGFGLDKYWYDSNPFPQLHAILSNHG